jgi:hypothetical protein
VVSVARFIATAPPETSNLLETAWAEAQVQAQASSTTLGAALHSLGAPKLEMSQRRKKERDAGAEDEEQRQYAFGGHTLEELDEK